MAIMKIPVWQPVIAAGARKYLLECLETGWVSSKGLFVARFEKAFGEFVGTKYAVATNSGTSAIHLALTALDVNQGDEVIVPALTMIAAALPIIYVGAKPVLVDVKGDTGNIDADKIEEKITSRTKAIIVVHYNGCPADMEKIMAIARKRKLFVIEDAAEAHGAEVRFNNGWRKVGSIGDIGCFSFYGNKIITAGEGGMAVTSDKNLAARMASLRNLARTEGKHFLHKEIAFAYRISNLNAALGLAQLEQIDKYLKRKREISRLYDSLLKDVKNIEFIKENVKSVNWQYSILVRGNSKVTRNKIALKLARNGIETRNFVVPLNRQPAFLAIGLFRNERYETAEKLSSDGLSLPSGTGITDREIRLVVKEIRQAFG